MEVGMSPSSFHKHFKFITQTTPLQYQKDLRLLEAKRLLNLKSHSVQELLMKSGMRVRHNSAVNTQENLACLLGTIWDRSEAIQKRDHGYGLRL